MKSKTKQICTTCNTCMPRIFIIVEFFLLLLSPSVGFVTAPYKRARSTSSPIVNTRFALQKSVPITLLHPNAQDANKELDRLVQQHDNTTVVSLQGYVSKRRALGSSLVFYDVVVAGSNETADDPVQALLRRDYFHAQESFAAYSKAIQPGTRVVMVGLAGPSRNPGESLLFIHEAEFLVPNRNPQHLRNILGNLERGLLPLEVFSKALRLDSNMLMNQICTRDHFELAKEILADGFSPKELLDPAALMGSSNNAKIGLLPPVPAELASPPAWLRSAIDKHGDATPALEEPVSVESVLEKTPSSTTPVTVLAWVRNRRRFQNGTTVLEVVDDFKPILGKGTDEFATDWKRLKCILHPSVMSVQPNERTSIAKPIDIYGTLLCAGARVLLRGFVVDKDQREASCAILWVTCAEMVRSSWRPKVIRHMLELLTSGHMDLSEAAQALELAGGYQEAEHVVRTLSLTERQWKAAEISQRLQDSNSLVGELTPDMERMLKASKVWRDAFPIERVECGQSCSKDTTISPLKYSSPGSKWERAKLPQLEWMLEQIRVVIDTHPGKRPLEVVDIGGGKGNLATFIAEEFGSDVHVRVVDISARSLNNGMMRSRRRNLKNVRFDEGDASRMNMQGVDVVVALHACGVLSDVAIGHAVSQGAAFIICPCCFRSNQSLMVTKHIPSMTSEKETKLVTDSEWLGIEQSEYDSLTLAAERQGDINVVGKAIHAVSALRARAATHHFRKMNHRLQLHVCIKAFPVGLSTRNLCIIGSIHAEQLRNIK